jgi:imidazole glycerol-phosphate synthase subunit HisF
MHFPRIIPRLDIKGQNLVKGIQLEGLRVLGKPEEFASLYYKQGADELIFQDVVASLYQRNSILDIVKRTARNIFIPLTVGGGLRNLDDIRNVLLSGADKVSINTAAIKNPQFINSASRTFGSSTIVISIESIQQTDGRYLAYTDNGREYTGLEVISWAKEAESRGAGEILITLIDQEGTGKGMDLEFLKLLKSNVDIPIIAHGGIGNYEDVFECIGDYQIHAIAIASMFHYGVVQKNMLNGSYENEGNTDFLKQKKTMSQFRFGDINGLKKYLSKNGIVTRE